MTVAVAYCLELVYHHYHHPSASVVAGSAFVDASVAAADVLAVVADVPLAVAAVDDAAVVGVADADGVVAVASVVAAVVTTTSYLVVLQTMTVPANCLRPVHILRLWLSQPDIIVSKLRNGISRGTLTPTGCWYN